MSNLYDPLTYDNLMAGMVLQFEQQLLNRLGDPINIYGPGIYSLVYTGALPAYQTISLSSTPIYVGKAVPPGSRRGDTVDAHAPALQARLREHARSIEQSENLNLDEFRYRFLAIVPVWITLAERFIIEYYKPVWNRCLDGFGDHDPGSGRYNGERSWWDTMHPGRTWAERLRDVKTVEEARTKIDLFFAPLPGQT